MSVHVNLPSQACARRSCQIARCDRPRKRRPAGIRRNTGGLYGGAISCRRRFPTDTILSASGNRRKRFGRRSKDLFWHRRQFSGRPRASALQNCPRPGARYSGVAPDFEMERRRCCRKPRDRILRASHRSFIEVAAKSLRQNSNTATSSAASPG
jgi:hypothetical protein